MYHEYKGMEHPYVTESNEKKEHGAEHLSAIYAMLSGNAKINVSDLYWHLEEVSGALDFDMPYKPEHEDFLHALIV